MTSIHRIISGLFYDAYLQSPLPFSINRQLQWFRTNEKKNREEIEGLQWSLLMKILDHAQQNVPYYRDLFCQSGISVEKINTPKEFSRIPLLSKANIHEKLNQMVSEVHDLRDLIPNATGGSTGTPTHFFYDREYKKWSNALAYRNLLWTGWKYGDPRAKIWGSSFDLKIMKNFRNKFQNWLENISIFPAFEMADTKFPIWVEELNRIKPDFFGGYANAVLSFAKLAKENGLQVSKLGLKGIISEAETLFPEARIIIEEAFSTKVFNRYGCRELSGIAQECSYGRMHINEDWVYLEVVDENGVPLPPGTTGQVVLTSFFNFGMPFIRYAIEDWACLDVSETQCECGCSFIALGEVIGRTTDHIILPGGGFLSGLFFPHLFKEYDIIRFQVIQPVLEILEVKYIPGENFNELQFEDMRNKIGAHLPGIVVHYQQVQNIPSTPSGKHRFTISRVSNMPTFNRD